jgi:hypothetical protein
MCDGWGKKLAGARPTVRASCGQPTNAEFAMKVTVIVRSPAFKLEFRATASMH